LVSSTSPKTVQATAEKEVGRKDAIAAELGMECDFRLIVAGKDGQSARTMALPISIPCDSNAQINCTRLSEPSRV
jgi:hypothetical protein